MSEPLLEISDLTVDLRSDRGTVRAVDSVSMEVAPGSRVGLIGESGSGKSVTALSVLRLHEERRVRYGTSSRIVFEGTDILKAPRDRLRRLRGREIAMVFQDPMAALNPVFPIGSQLAHVLRSHLGIRGSEARKRILTLLDEVEIQAPDRQLRRYPHELSGGMRQRVLIAMALLCEPRILLADEPTSALDVTVQAAVLQTIEQVANRHGTTVVLITHDMGVVARFCDEVHVMYAGRIVERGTVAAIFARPRHPYTAGLLRSTPRVDADPRDRMEPIPGAQRPRRVGETPLGCPFAPRCEGAQDRCRRETPELGGPGMRHAACLRQDELVYDNEGRLTDERGDPHR